jgi:membrane-associated phospholipid phosphatase
MQSKDKRILFPSIGIAVSIGIIIAILFIDIFFIWQWNQVLRDGLPNTAYFFRFVTEFGGTLTYLAIFFVIFWGIDKQLGKSLISVYVFGSTVNYYAKAAINYPRPPQFNWILISASHMSTPSGHAMSSFTFWGYLAQKSKTVVTWIISIILIILVGLSRMYLGVHWFGDILTGWLFGLIVLLLVWMFEEPIKSMISKINPMFIYLGIVIIGGIMMGLTQWLYPLADINDFGSDGGKIIGLGLGLALEQAFVKFEIEPAEGRRGRRILRVMIGMITFAGLFLGLYLLLDTSLFYWETLQFVITMVYGIFIYPLIFTKLKL